MLARTSLDVAKGLGIHRLITKNGKKSIPVGLLVEVDNSSIQSAIHHAKVSSNIAGIIYKGTEQCYSTLDTLDTQGVELIIVERVLGDVTEEDIETLLKVIPSWATLVVELPEDFNNMEFIYNISIKHDRVRFMGGYLFSISGCKLGICSEESLAEVGIKTQGELLKTGYCVSVDVVDADTIVIEQMTAKDKIARVKSDSKPTTSKASVKTMMFQKMLSGDTAFGSSGF